MLEKFLEVKYRKISLLMKRQEFSIVGIKSNKFVRQVLTNEIITSLSYVNCTMNMNVLNVNVTVATTLGVIIDVVVLH